MVKVGAVLIWSGSKPRVQSWKWAALLSHWGRTKTRALRSRARDAASMHSCLKCLKEGKLKPRVIWRRESALSYFSRAHFSDSDPSEGLNTWTITILRLLLLLHQLSGRKTRLAPAAAAPTNPFHSFQTGMPIFRVLLSAVMAVGSLASFNPSLPPASWLAEGMPLRSKPPPLQILTTPPHLPFSNVEEDCVYVGREGWWWIE